MGKKNAKIAAITQRWQEQGFDAHYLGFFDCFNQGQYFEAHEVLEVLWLGERSAPRGDFYKGLIQLAGAFVHLQKDRLLPAAALFKLALTNLRRYPSVYEGWQITAAINLIVDWLNELKANVGRNPLSIKGAPQLELPKWGVFMAHGDR